MTGKEMVQTFANSLPAEIREQMQANISTDLARLGNSGGKDAIRVTQDKQFQFPDDTKVDAPLSLIIVDFVYRNEYYLGAFNRKELAAPACFAVAAEQINLVPTDNSPKKQAEKCNVCQWDKYGSSPNGDGKACKNTVYMAVLPPDATEDSTLYVLKSSPTAITPFNNYVIKVARATQLAVWGVTTKVNFDPNLTYASLRFDIAGPNPIAEIAAARRQEARHRLLQEPDFSSFETK
jgi:hypothetical protein